MTHGTRRMLAGLAFTGLAALAPSPLRSQTEEFVEARGYQFTKISTEAFDPFSFGNPAINNRGAVAFRAELGATSTTGVFRGRGGPLTVIADESDGLGFIGFHPSINNTGQVSFAATLDDGDGEIILRGDGLTLTEIARTEPGPFNFFGFDTFLNDNGEVAFKAEIDNFDEGLFVGDGTTLTTIYLASGSRFGGDDSGPSNNDLGEVAFSEFTDNGLQGNFLFSEGNFVTIATDRGPIGFADIPVLNNLGRVAFHAFSDLGPDEFIFVGDGSQLIKMIGTKGRLASLGNPSLNNRNAVAFSADLDNGGQGVFVTSPAGLLRIIGTGDALDGSTVTGVVLSREGLNDRGELAFRVFLADGRTEVFRATPPQ